ncbi:phage baseplate assembly protein V [Methylobacterium nodulans]|uniref:Phage baseplate assembly protein V n=1 Tax=Methylobacterium nodulans (strain LMG 21967 / CNCM I-2342 / ORS 2060) TaxID=460265 RepID=B8IDQ5_METNO|nr:phage baseplate assembly protein V [Methylobacterium nodulans]ACL55627.1 phage baseplate assembly protein V [Methylobacterium nodulans ORS 2060]
MSDFSDLLDAVLELRREHEALKTRVANLIRPGKVTDRDHEKGVRIDLGGGTDEEPNKSTWVKSSDHSGVMSYLPREGEQGWLLSPNGDQEQGAFWPLTHSDQKRDPAPDADTTVLFNRDDVTISIKDGTVHIKTKKKITWEVDGKSYTFDGKEHVFQGDKIKHDGKNIGKDHVHGGVQTGNLKTDVPDA